MNVDNSAPPKSIISAFLDPYGVAEDLAKYGPKAAVRQKKLIEETCCESEVILARREARRKRA